MAKLTYHRSSITIITEDVANSWYGGLYGRNDGDGLDETDPLVAGHVHDGQHLDGHAQKIHLEDHVTGQIQNDRIADDAVTKRNIKGFTTQADAIPVSEVIDGTTYYYLNVDEGSGAFATVNNVTSNSPGTLGTDDLVFGSDSLDDDGDSTHDNRLLFDKSKGAFRAGSVAGTQWNDSNRGSYSTAFGLNTVASASYSTALGYGATSTLHGAVSMAGGFFATAGDAMAQELIWRGTSIDDATTEIFLDGSSTRATLTNGEYWCYDLIFIGKRTDSTDAAASGRISGSIKRDASAASTTLTAGVTEGSSLVTVSADTTNGALKVTTTGPVGYTIRWVVHGRIVKVSS